jgi:hypothetical protein
LDLSLRIREAEPFFFLGTSFLDVIWLAIAGSHPSPYQIGALAIKGPVGGNNYMMGSVPGISTAQLTAAHHYNTIRYFRIRLSSIRD